MTSGDAKKAAAIQQELDREIRRLSARRTRRSFLTMAAGAMGGYGVYEWLQRSRPIGQLQLPLRRAEEWNAALSKAVFREQGLAPTYPVSKAVADLRFNGNFGLNLHLQPDSWRLQLTGVAHPETYAQYAPDVNSWVYRSYAQTAGAVQVKPRSLDAKGPVHLSQTLTIQATTAMSSTPGLLLTMDDIRRLPHRELVTQFKCIEGWSEIVHWGGVRLADLIDAFPPAGTPGGGQPEYVSMETPDGEYYCGYDMVSCRHPQSLLVYEMSGQPLNKWHGAPLRLHMPTKYGYKQLKQIGRIRYSNIRPQDFWAKLGYDWYAGL